MRQDELDPALLAWLFSDTEWDPETNTTKNEG
jgi:uncharacterized phage infection (PIP) family protein YhgE